jgi:hypothetical protein
MERFITPLLGSLFVLLLAYTLYLIYQSIALHYLPLFSDEYGYAIDAKNFWLYNRLDAATTLNESYSLLGHAGFHGFMYSLLYGSAFKLFALLGIPPSVMLVNALIALLSLLLLLSSRIEWTMKYLIGIVFLTNFIFVIYLASSMTELLHYAFALIVAYLLHLLYQTRERRYLYLLLAVLVFLIPFRESWVFVLFGLFPLTRSAKEFVGYTLLLLIGLAAVLLYQHYFQAAFPVDYFHQLKTQLDDRSMLDTLTPLYQHLIENIDKYFISERYPHYPFVFYYKYLFVFVMLYAIIDGIWTKNREILAAALIATVFFSSLLLLYDPFGWREVRTLAAPFLLMVILLILNRRFAAVTLIVLFQLALYSSVLDTKKGIDEQRAQMNQLIEANRGVIEDFSGFGDYLDRFDKEEILVLIDGGLVPFDSSPLFYSLPLQLKGKAIRYSFIYRSFDLATSQCDIFISNRAIDHKQMTLLGKNDHFYFYRNTP